MQKNAKERIKIICCHLGIQGQELAQEINLERQTIYNIKENISEPVARKIAEKYPQFRYEWLLTGEGPMLRTDNSNQGGTVGENSGIIVQHGDHSTYNNNSDLLSVVHAQQETISRQSDTIATLTETNRQQSEQIGKLIEMLSLK